MQDWIGKKVATGMAEVGRHEKFGKWLRGRFITYAQGFRVNAACSAASPPNNYTYDDVLRIYTCI